jgi:RimJ/RimL family protein N-acetyltransferase
MMQTILPPPLPDEVLSKRDSLPVKPDPVVLLGQYVRLEPLVVDRDAQPLFEVSNGKAISFGERSVDAYDADALIWRYMFDGPFENRDEFAAFLQTQIDAPHGLCLCVFDLATGRQIGVANFLSSTPMHLKIELGSIWYSPVAQRTQANTEATYLMLKHAFELGYLRVEWKCHAQNERSRRAALRMGFKFEGIQDSHMIAKGRSRDTAWFRLLAHEWSTVKQKLELLLNKPHEK